LSRDPIAEKGGYNLYGFVGNEPLNSIDYLGAFKKSRTQIIMEDCEIVIYYGHNFGPKKLPKFD
jgi:hypothetical protein